MPKIILKSKKKSINHTSLFVFQMYIQYRLEIKFSMILKFFLQAGLVCLSLVCGFTRITDNMHHSTDVATGFVLGIIIAIFVVCILWNCYIICNIILSDFLFRFEIFYVHMYILYHNEQTPYKKTTLFSLNLITYNR